MEITHTNMEGRSFLIVDDVRFTRMTLARMLREMGSTNVQEAADGAAALQWLSEPGHQADCVIADIQMPNMTGLELLKAIRVGTGGIPRDLPVVILTTQSDLATMGTALLLHHDEFIAKPVRQQALRACLDRIFDPAVASKRASLLASPEVYRAVDPKPAPIEAVAPGAGSQRERSVLLADVPEGAVLARDLLHENRRLLLPAGARLDAAMLARIRQMVGSSGAPQTVWIVG